jgi:hypothetical protein
MMNETLRELHADELEAVTGGCPCGCGTACNFTVPSIVWTNAGKAYDSSKPLPASFLCE